MGSFAITKLDRIEHKKSRLISVIPFMAAITCLVLILNYKLDQARHREIVRDIELRESHSDSQ